MIRYKFPLVSFDDDNYNDYEVITHEATLFPRKISSTPYEADLRAFEETFDLVIDQARNGMLLCIPSRNFCCFINTPWGCEESYIRLENTGDLDEDEAVAISYGLNELYKLVKEQKQIYSKLW